MQMNHKIPNGELYVVVSQQISFGDEPGYPFTNIRLVTHNKKFAYKILNALESDGGTFGGTAKWPRFAIIPIKIEDPKPMTKIYGTIENFIDSLINGPQ